jgi:ferrous iron transport protein A
VNRLVEISLGGKAVVRGVTGTDEVSLRLLEMGLTPGVEVRLVGLAPLGDPLELELRGYRLSVRKSEAARIEVELIA